MPDSSSVLDELQTHQLTSTWPAELLLALQPISRIVTFPAGRQIFAQGDSNNALFLISEGRVALEMHVPARGQIHILTVSQGEILAWSALIGDQQMTTSAITLEPTRAVAIDGEQLKQLCDRTPEKGYLVMQRVASALARRLVATRLQLLDLYSHPKPDPILGFSGGQ